MLVIQVERLKNNFIARPQNGLGTIGWSPFPWTMVYGNTAQQAYDRFIDQHRSKIGDTETKMVVSN